MSIDELRSCQALLLEYIAFFLAERRGADLSKISGSDVQSIEATIAEFIAKGVDLSEAGPDIVKLLDEWRRFEGEAQSIMPMLEKPQNPDDRADAWLGDPSAEGWLMRALKRRGLRGGDV